MRLRTAGAHRMVPEAPRPMPEVIAGVRYTICRWCLEPIRKPDGSPDLRRSWHPDCVDAYMARRSPQHLRRIVFKRDHGVCAACGRECAKLRTAEKDWWRYPAWEDAEGRWWKETNAWEADHRVPLIDGGSFELDNVQTLCAGCHEAKSSREATERAYRRRQEERRAAGQEVLFEV